MRASLTLTALVSGVILLGGCGDSNNTDPGNFQPVSTPTPPPVSTPAAPEKLRFDQLNLESQVKRNTDANGLVFYSFSFSDQDGKVYKCNLPEAMAQGEFTTDGWIRTFNLYREPEVIKQKPVTQDSNKDGLNDFPFIAPKRAPTSTQSAPEGAPAPPPPPVPQNAPGEQQYAPTPMPRG